MRRLALLVAMTACLIGATACDRVPEPTLAPTAVAAATPTPVSPTSSPTPSSTPTPADTSTPTPTSTPTATSTPTDTPSPIPTFTLSGIVFFDYNGNGVHDAHEPPIPGATVQVGSLATKSGEDGSYILQGIPKGKHQVKLAAEDFGYISLSLEALQAVEEPVSVVVEGDLRKDWGLMEGFLTLPLPKGTEISIIELFDLDPRPGHVRAYNGSTVVGCVEGREGFACDGHNGIDYRLPIGTSVLAPAPGTVHSVETLGPDSDCEGSILLRIDHKLEKVWARTLYSHLSEVKVAVGQKVARGDMIAKSGNTGICSGEPHLHFSLFDCLTSGPCLDLDPYRDVTFPTSRNYWTKDNDPQCVE